MPQLLILDATVAAKWYLDDEDAVEIAERCLVRLLSGEIEFHAPELLRYEVAQALHLAQTKARGRFNRGHCENSYRTFCRLPIRYHSLKNEEMQKALEFANRFNKNFYDCSYLCLAETLNCRWITDDRKGYEKNLPAGFPQERVLMLRSFG